MKKLLPKLLLLACTAALAGNTAQADVAVNATNFPDSAMRVYVNTFDKDKDGTLSDTEIANVKTLYISNSKILDITGIQYFTSATYLQIFNSKIENIDLSVVPWIQRLQLWSDSVKTVNTSNLTKLTDINIGYCPNLTAVDITAATGLTNYANFNQCSSLRSLDFSKNVALKKIDVENCSKLASVTLPGTTTLTKFILNQAAITSIDLSKCTGITNLQMRYDTKIKSIDVSALTALKQLQLTADSALTTVNVNGLSNLTTLNLFSSPVESIDLAQVPNVTSLTLSGTHLVTVDISNNTKLTSLSMDNMPLITSFTWPESVAGVRSFSIYDCPKLATLDVSNATNLRSLSCYNNALTTLTMGENIYLTDLQAYNNQLSSIDLSELTALQSLQLNDNKFKSIDVSENTKLQKLYLSNNNLSAIDVSANTAVTDLRLSHNNLSSIDLSNNNGLNYLYLDHNNLSAVDLNGKTNLYEAYLSVNKIKKIDMTSLTSRLQILEADTNYIASIDMSKVTYRWLKPKLANNGRHVSIPAHEDNGAVVYQIAVSDLAAQIGDGFDATKVTSWGEGTTLSADSTTLTVTADTVWYTYYTGYTNYGYGYDDAQYYKFYLSYDKWVPTAVNDVDAAAQPVDVTYYNTLGVAAREPFEGINIVVTRYSDGTTTTRKVMK